MSFIRLYLCPRYRKNVKSISELTKYINKFKTLVLLLTCLFNHHDQPILYGQSKPNKKEDDELLH